MTGNFLFSVLITLHRQCIQLFNKRQQEGSIHVFGRLKITWLLAILNEHRGRERTDGGKKSMPRPINRWIVRYLIYLIYITRPSPKWVNLSHIPSKETLKFNASWAIASFVQYVSFRQIFVACKLLTPVHRINFAIKVAMEYQEIFGEQLEWMVGSIIGCRWLGGYLPVLCRSISSIPSSCETEPANAGLCHGPHRPRFSKCSRPFADGRNQGPRLLIPRY